jgi:hypothetical protein
METFQIILFVLGTFGSSQAQLSWRQSYMRLLILQLQRRVGRFMGDFGAILGPFLGDFWAIFGRFLADFWPIFGRFLADFWPIFGRFLADFFINSSGHPVDRVT